MVGQSSLGHNHDIHRPHDGRYSLILHPHSPLLLLYCPYSHDTQHTPRPLLPLQILQRLPSDASAVKISNKSLPYTSYFPG